MKSDMAKDHVVSKPGKRNPDIDFFDDDPDITRDEIVQALKSQNPVLENAEIFFKTMFQGRKYRNAVVILDPESFRRIVRKQKLKLSGA